MRIRPLHLTPLLLMLAFTASAADAGAASGWHLLQIDKVGWGGVVQDLAKDKETSQELLHTMPHVYLASSTTTEGGGSEWYVIYYPSAENWSPPPKGDRPPENDLKVATVTPDQPRGERVSIAAVDHHVLMGAEKHQFAQEMSLAIAPGPDGPHLWYIHPFRSLIVDYDLARHAPARWITYPKNLHNRRFGILPFLLSLAVDPKTDAPYLALPQGKYRLIYCVCNMGTGDWDVSTVQDKSALPHLLLTQKGTYVLADGAHPVLYFRPKQVAGAKGKAKWQADRIGPAATVKKASGSKNEDNQNAESEALQPFLGDHTLLALPDGRVEIFQDNTNQISTLSKTKSGWVANAIKNYGKEETPFKTDSYWSDEPSITVAPDGRFQIACYDGAEKAVQHIWKQNGDWWAEKVADSGPVASTAVMVADGKLVIAYVDVDTRDVVLTYRDWAAARPGEPVNPQGGAVDLSAEIRKAEAAKRAAQRASDEWSQVSDAVMDDNVKQLQKLASEGINVNAPDDKGDTALHTAAIQVAVNAARYLVAHGANVNARDKDNMTSLDQAVRADEFLAENGPIKVPATKGKAKRPNPVTRSQTQAMLKLLLDNGATVDICAAAALGRKDQVAGMLAEDPKLLDYRVYGDPPLLWAADAGQVAVVKLLLDAGANANTRADDGDTALIEAVVGESTAAASLLLERGADTSLSDKIMGWNALDTAGSKSMIDLLLAHGAEINARDGSGQTALHWKVFLEQPDLTAYLIAQGADLNAQDNDGDTPLHEAVKFGQLKEIKLLVAKGASLDIRNKDGLTPLDLARKAAVQGKINMGSGTSETLGPAEKQQYRAMAEFLSEAADKSTH